MLSRWREDLRGLSDDGVRERLRLAQSREASSLERGSGRNPKAARMWRENATLAQAELDRRGLVS